MASKLIVIRQQLTSALHAAFQAFAGETSPVLDDRMAPFLDDQDATFDFEALQAALARMIASSLERLVTADKTHLDELVGGAEPRRERDRRVTAVRAKLIDVRHLVTGLFGADRAREIVAVDGATAEQPELLWRQAEHTVSRLRDPELRLPPPSTRAVPFDPNVLADELEPLVTALREAIDGIELDVRQAATTLQVKKEAMAEHDRLTSACGRILSGLCLLADRPDLARRVRVTPPRSRRGRKPSADSQEPVGVETAAVPEDPPAAGTELSLVAEPASIADLGPRGLFQPPEVGDRTDAVEARQRLPPPSSPARTGSATDLGSRDLGGRNLSMGEIIQPDRSVARPISGL